VTARLSRHTLLLLISNVGSAILLFALSALIGRILGTEGLGVYAVALAWTYPLSLLVEFGLATLMTRDLAQHPEATQHYLATVALERLTIGGLVMLLLFIAAPILSDDPVVVMGIQVSAPMVILVPFFSTFTAIYRAHGVMWPIPWLNIGMLAVQVALTAWVLLNGGTVLDALIINVATSAGQVAAAWWVYKRYFERSGHHVTFDYRRQEERLDSQKPDAEIVEANQPAPPLHDMESMSGDTISRILPLMRRAFPFAMAALFFALQIRLSLILLESLSSTTEAGYFTAANRFVEAARMFPNALFGALFPALSALALNPAVMAKTFRRAMLGLALFGVIAGVGFTILAGFLLNLVYGAEFAPAVPTLIVLGWSLLFGVLRGGRTLYWYALERERYVNVVNASVLVLQIGLGFWLVPTYGALGAAVGFLVVEAAALALLWRAIHFPRIKTMQGDLDYEGHKE
jgi:O-antigen/teichoic acid export membrane protein